MQGHEHIHGNEPIPNDLKDGPWPRRVTDMERQRFTGYEVSPVVQYDDDHCEAFATLAEAQDVSTNEGTGEVFWTLYGRVGVEAQAIADLFTEYAALSMLYAITGIDLEVTGKRIAIEVFTGPEDGMNWRAL